MAREWLTRQEAAEHFKISPRSIDRILSERPELACRPLGPRSLIRISVADLDAYMASTRQAGKAA